MYAVIDPDGNLQYVENDLNTAYVAAQSLASEVVIEGESGADPFIGSAFGGYGAGPSRMPETALRMSGLPRMSGDEVLSMSLEEAWERLLPFFPEKRLQKGHWRRVRTFDAPEKMAKHILGQNYKTSIETPEEPSKVMGLSLLPHTLTLDMVRGPLPMRGGGFCVGASEECKASCLVYAGHNLIDPYNVVKKRALSVSLLKQPVAFSRMLVDAIRRHFDARRRSPLEPFVRLNVFSDIPWELVFPDLFDLFYENQFYDYTKVAGRQLPHNYDITFSWSGTNQRLVDEEIEAGRRVAVVFMLPGGRTARRKTSMPASFLGLPVVDGDDSDVRPRDPAPSIVGLRWKMPMHKRKVSIAAFVVRVEEVDGQLVAVHSARQNPIEDPDDEDEDDE